MARSRRTGVEVEVEGWVIVVVLVVDAVVVGRV